MKRLIIWLLHHWFYEELVDARCKGYSKGYLAGLWDTDTQDYLNGKELRELLGLSPGGTDD